MLIVPGITLQRQIRFSTQLAWIKQNQPTVNIMNIVAAAWHAYIDVKLFVPTASKKLFK